MQPAGVYIMTVTSKIDPTIKFKAKVTIEADADRDECFGEVQDNFLWEQFDFEMKHVENVELPHLAPINIYEDEELLSK